MNDPNLASKDSENCVALLLARVFVGHVRETAEKLITSNDVEITAEGKFNSAAYWGRWSKAYHHSRNRAPAFMRAGEFVRSPKPQCRLNPEAKPSGCGKKCVFCMQAGDGHGCPVKSARNDISKGIGLHAAFCGGGDKLLRGRCLMISHVFPWPYSD